jgi:hypothetical protein
LRQFADVEANLKRAEELLDKAFAMGCEMVILPEFFTSAVAFHPDMLNAALPFDGPAREDHPFRGPAGRLLDPQAALAHQVGVVLPEPARPLVLKTYPCQRVRPQQLNFPARNTLGSGLKTFTADSAEF